MSLSGKARVAGVMGWPVAHSRSPRLHGFWLREYAVDGAYVPFAVAPDQLAAALNSLRALNLAGVNLTIPHKEAAFEHVDQVSDLAAEIGAINTVTVGKDGVLHGDNTDGFGFIENIRAAATGFDFSAGPTVVLGAGGAARAVCVALLGAGAREIRLLNRTQVRAEALKDRLGQSLIVEPWLGRNSALADAYLVVNTTSLGMSGQPALDVDLDQLPTSALVNDLVYAPLETPLLASARQRGNVVVDGLGMLLHQARPGFAAWFGVEPEVTDALRAHIVSDLTD